MASSYCQTKWDEIFFAQYIGQTIEEADSLIAQWQDLHSTCGGKLLYEYRLGQLHTLAKRYDMAETIFLDALKNYTTENTAILESGLLDNKFQKLMKGNGKNRDEFLELTEEYTKYHYKYPNDQTALDAVSTIFFLLNEFDKTIVYANKSVQIKPTFYSYRMLTVARASKKDWNGVLTSASMAAKYNARFSEDFDFMIAIALSYGHLGDLENFKGALNSLLGSRPGLKENPEYRPKFDKAVKYYLHLKQEADNNS